MPNFYLTNNLQTYNVRNILHKYMCSSAVCQFSLLYQAHNWVTFKQSSLTQMLGIKKDLYHKKELVIYSKYLALVSRC